MRTGLIQAPRAGLRRRRNRALVAGGLVERSQIVQHDDVGRVAFDHPLMRDGFGHGPRMCLGARVAQLELQLVVAHVIRAHRLSVDGARGFHVANHASTYPDPAPKLKFEPR